MKVCIKDIEWEPESFSPFEYFKVFWDEDRQEVIGCGNIIFNPKEDICNIEVKYLEAYGEGKGSEIVKYLLKENLHVNIVGSSYKETKGFWSKQGALFEEEKSGLYPFIIRGFKGEY